MRARSNKRAGQERQYLLERRVFLERRWRCEMRLDGCTTWATEVHHMRGREGDRLLEQEFWMPGCNGCHRQVTDHVVDPYALGLSIHRNANLG